MSKEEKPGLNVTVNDASQTTIIDNTPPAAAAAPLKPAAPKP